MHASLKLAEVKGDNFDQDQGINIVREACKIPCKTICQNSGVEGSIVCEKLLEKNDPTWGFDAAKGEYCNLLERGVIDPTKVVRTAMIDSAGVASLMITTEATIIDVKEDGGAGGAPGGMPPGMGGMGGMGGMM